jgi:hypothetical protein
MSDCPLVKLATNRKLLKQFEQTGQLKIHISDWLRFFEVLAFISRDVQPLEIHCAIPEKVANAWCLFFDFYRRQEHIKKRKLLQLKGERGRWRRVRDSNPQALSGAGFQDRCNSQFCQLSAKCAGHLKRAHPTTSNFGFQRSGLWACLARRFKASMRIAMPLKAIDQRLRPQEEEAGV